MNDQIKPSLVAEKPAKPMKCPACRAVQAEPVDLCPHCSFPYQAPEGERKQFLSLRKELTQQYSASRARIRMGSTILVFLGIIGVLQVFMNYFALKDGVSSGLFWASILGSVFFAALYLVCGVMGNKKHGIVFITIGTTFYFFETVMAVLGGINVFSVVKVGFLVALVIAFIGTIGAYQSQKHIERTLGKDFMDRLKKWED